MRQFFTLFVFLIAINLNAQNTLITAEGDTIQGKVIIELPDPLYEDVIIKNDDGRTRYKAYEVLGFEKDGEKYQTVKHKNKYRIMRVEQSGYLSLYYFREDESYDFGTRYLGKLDGSGMVIPNISFKKQVADFLSDCKSVSNSIEEGNLKKKDLEEIIKKYNECIANSTIQKTLEINEVKDSSHPGVDIINRMKKNVDSSNTELTTLLNDILSKIVAGKNIPSYLKEALKEQTKDQNKLSDDVEKLINSLN